MALCPRTNQPLNDVVMTPPAMAQAIVDELAPTGACLDPCRGEGAFYDAFLPHTPVRHWCEITEGRDFLTDDLPTVDWIITNPPWSKIAPFLETSFRIANNVAFLATVTNFVTRYRLELARNANFGLTEFIMLDRPGSWTPSGFQVAVAVYRRDAPNRTTWSTIQWSE